MNRLTYKLDESIKTKYLNYEYGRIKDHDIMRGNLGRITDDMIFNKLGQLEDIEEENGMSLLTLFRILKCGEIIYKNRSLYHNNNKIILESRKIDGLYYDGAYYILKLHNLLFEDDNDNYDVVYVKDYGITWAITREELEYE